MKGAMVYIPAFIFFARKTSMFSLREALKDVTTLPAALNTRSEGMLVAQMVIYFRATLESRGNRTLLSRHQTRGSAWESRASSCKYLLISVSTRILLGVGVDVFSFFSPSKSARFGFFITYIIYDLYFILHICTCLAILIFI